MNQDKTQLNEGFPEFPEFPQLEQVQKVMTVREFKKELADIQKRVNRALTFNEKSFKDTLVLAGFSRDEIKLMDYENTIRGERNF